VALPVPELPLAGAAKEPLAPPVVQVAPALTPLAAAVHTVCAELASRLAEAACLLRAQVRPPQAVQQRSGKRARMRATEAHRLQLVVALLLLLVCHGW
jgi:hypothetical protein